MRNKPGALYQLLELFHRHGVSLTRLETRPSTIVALGLMCSISDFEGHMDDEQAHKVLAEVEKKKPLNSNDWARIRSVFSST